MSTSLRLALVLVVITLGFTLALLVGADSDDGRVMLVQLGERVRSFCIASLTTVRRDHAPPESGDGSHSASTTSSRGGSASAPSPAAAFEPAAPSSETNGAPTAATADDRERSTPAEIDSTPTFVTAWPADLKSGVQSNVQLTGAALANEGPVFLTSGQKIKELIVRNQDITNVFELLSSRSQRNIIASRNVRGPITITLYNTTVDDAIAAIVKMQGLVARQEGDYLRVYTPEDLEEAENQAGMITVRVYKPRFISAIDLVNILTPHLSSRGKISNTKPNQIGIAANADSAGGDSLAVDDAIVIQDVESVLQRVDDIITRVDVRPPQVLIEATVLRVELNDANQMGVNFAVRSGHSLSVSGQGGLIQGAAGFKPAFLVDGLGQIRDGFADTEHGLKFGVVRGDLTAFVKLLETVGHTTLVASPKVLTMNKQRADIIVGAQLGYRTVTTTETAAVENIQFLEVGTQLRVRPFVQADGMIRLELHPEKSSGKVSESTGLPEKATTQVTANLAVPSGTTVVIGGLIEEEQQKSVQQVPLLGSLPWVGSLFRDETTTTRRQEIIVLITPRVVDESTWDCAAQRELDLFEARRDALERSFPPYTRIALSRKYYEKAYWYRDAGDVVTAQKMACLAVHFNPSDAAAVQLRDELMAVDEHSSVSADPAPPISEELGSAPQPKLPAATTRKDWRGRMIK